MSKYIKHLEQMYSPKTFGRKIDYFRYNFSDILAKADSKAFSVLEIGPGMGESISYLNRLGVNSIDVIDNDKGILDAISGKFKIRKAILSKDIGALGRNMNKYDLIIMIQVLEHMPFDKQAEVISMLYSRLKRDGNVILVVPNANNPLGLAERYGDFQHTSAFTTRSLTDLIDNSKIRNYEIVISGYEIPPYSLVNLTRIVLQKILHAILYLMMIINGGVFFRVMTPNIVLRIKKKG